MRKTGATGWPLAALTVSVLPYTSTSCEDRNKYVGTPEPLPVTDTVVPDDVEREHGHRAPILRPVGSSA